MMDKRPRHYALDLISADSDDAKKTIYQSIPENYRKLVMAHYNSFVAKERITK